MPTRLGWLTLPMPKVAKYRCLKCDHEWSQLQGGSKGWGPDGRAIQPDPPPVKCRSCGHLYLKWLNYDSEFAR